MVVWQAAGAEELREMPEIQISVLLLASPHPHPRLENSRAKTETKQMLRGKEMDLEDVGCCSGCELPVLALRVSPD